MCDNEIDIEGSCENEGNTLREANVSSTSSTNLFNFFIPDDLHLFHFSFNYSI